MLTYAIFVRTLRSAWSKLCVKMEGIIDVADDRLERRNYKTSVQPVKADRCKERVTFYLTHATCPSTWQNTQSATHCQEYTTQKNSRNSVAHGLTLQNNKKLQLLVYFATRKQWHQCFSWRDALGIRNSCQKYTI